MTRPPMTPCAAADTDRTGAARRRLGTGCGSAPHEIHALTITVVIPTLNEEQRIGATLDAVRALEPSEVIVADGGSGDRTASIVAERRCGLVIGPPGRALQMNAGAAAARSDVLLFLHADTALPATAVTDVTNALADPRVVGGRFDVRVDHPGTVYRVVESLMNARSRLTGIATGDQGIFVRRGVFEDLRGFAPLPLMEDIDFSRRLKRRGRLACLRSRVLTSARRWERGGPWRTIALMWGLRAGYALGVSPQRLARAYAAIR